jgi:hypothetical protein
MSHAISDSRTHGVDGTLLEAHQADATDPEDGVTDNSQTLAATMVGAVIGGIAAYLLFTDQGRSVRRRLEPAIEDFARELNGLRSTVQKFSAVANQGWGVLNEALGEAPAPPRYPASHQSSPF